MSETDYIGSGPSGWKEINPTAEDLFTVDDE